MAETRGSHISEEMNAEVNRIVDEAQAGEPSRGAPDAEREAFEKWAAGPKLPLERHGSALYSKLYAEYMTQLAWMAWKASGENSRTALLEALKRRQQYGHAVGCNSAWVGNNYPCGCGFVEAEAAIRKAEG